MRSAEPSAAELGTDILLRFPLQRPVAAALPAEGAPGLAADLARFAQFVARLEVQMAEQPGETLEVSVAGRFQSAEPVASISRTTEGGIALTLHVVPTHVPLPPRLQRLVTMSHRIGLPQGQGGSSSRGRN